jgi:hypothetical protein
LFLDVIVVFCPGTYSAGCLCHQWLTEAVRKPEDAVITLVTANSALPECHQPGRGKRLHTSHVPTWWGTNTRSAVALPWRKGWTGRQQGEAHCDFGEMLSENTEQLVLQ